MSIARRITISAAIFWIPLILFCYLAGQVALRDHPWYDDAALQWLHTHSSPLLDRVFTWVSELGSALVIGPVTIALSWLLYYLKRVKDALLLFISVAGASAANFILKLLFQRDRPELWQSIVHEPSYSFPSGHAMASSALVFALIAISWRTRWRWPVLVGSVLVMILVGLSRLYLGVHYPTDVLAGWCASLAWVGVVAGSMRHAVMKPIMRLVQRSK